MKPQPIPSRRFSSPAAMARALGTARYPFTTHRGCAEWFENTQQKGA